MNTNHINFKRKRDFGDIFNDTFAFLRASYKPLFSILTKTCGIAFVIMLVTVAYYNYTSLNLTGGNFFSGIQNADNTDLASLFIALFIMAISAMFFYSLLFGTTLHYIKSYIKTEGNVNHDEVIQNVRKQTGTLIGVALLSGLMVSFGTMLCLIPGIYLYVPLSLVFALVVFEDKSASDAISDSFKLIKNEWWVTFASLFVMSILISIIGGVFSMPAIIYGIIKGVAAASEGSFTDPTIAFDWVFVTLTTISSAVQYILYVIMAVTVGLLYFNLNEIQNFTGTFEQIDSLGKND